ncbi:MAG: response regulator transcription factor [Bdellovibrionota bacterium]
MSKQQLRRYISWSIGLTLILNFVFLVKDISDDVKEGAGFWHIGPEILIVFGTVLIAVLALLQFRKMKERSDTYAEKVLELQNANQDWQERTKVYAEGLSREIDLQLARWELSGAEKEVALLLLKGLSNKEISEVRDTAEHTIKQQSSAIYRKSGLGSRAELSAFFLEDLLTPQAFEPNQSSLSH